MSPVGPSRPRAEGNGEYMTAKWTVLALLAAAPAFSQNTISLTYDGYDAVHSSVNPGFFCSPAKPATVTPTATGFSFPVNWSCWNGDATVTGSVTVAYSPAVVTATKSGTWDTLNLSPPIVMTATATISGTGVTGASLTAMTGFVSPKGLITGPMSPCKASSIGGPGQVTLNCTLTYVGGTNDTWGLLPEPGIELSVTTRSHAGEEWSDEVDVYGKYKLCSGSACPSDKIAFVTSSYFPNPKDPIMVGDKAPTPHFYAQVLYDLESVSNGQVSLELLGSAGDAPARLAYSDKTFNVTQGSGTLGADGKLTVGPVTPPADMSLTGLTLRAVLSDGSGHELAYDVVHYPASSVTLSLQLGCASGSGSQSGTADPNTFIPDTSPPKVFFRLRANQQICPLGPGLLPAVQITYTSGAHGVLYPNRLGKIDAPDGQNRQVVVYVSKVDQMSWDMAAVERYHASQYESFLVSFETDSGQTAAWQSVPVPVQFVNTWPAAPNPVPAGVSTPVSVHLDFHLVEEALKLYRKLSTDADPTLISFADTDTFTVTPSGKEDTVWIDYFLAPVPQSPVGWAHVGVMVSPATVAIPPVSGTPATVTAPAASLSVSRNSAPRSVATAKLSQTIDNVKAAANANTGNLPSPQFMRSAPAADASMLPMAKVTA